MPNTARNGTCSSKACTCCNHSCSTKTCVYSTWLYYTNAWYWQYLLYIGHKTITVCKHCMKSALWRRWIGMDIIPWLYEYWSQSVVWVSSCEQMHNLSLFFFFNSYIPFLIQVPFCLPHNIEYSVHAYVNHESGSCDVYKCLRTCIYFEALTVVLESQLRI